MNKEADRTLMHSTLILMITIWIFLFSSRLLFENWNGKPSISEAKINDIVWHCL